MARVKYGGIVTDLSGSVGGSTFQKNAYGSILRNKPLPFTSRSSLQVTSRQYMKQLHVAWSELTAAQRSMWNNFKNYGGQTINRDRNILLSGHGLFIKYNYLRLMCSLAIMSTPVFDTMPAVEHNPQFPKDGATFYCTFANAIDKDLYWFILKVSSPRRSSRVYSPAGLKYMNITPADASDFQIQTLYAAAFGAIPASGDFIHYCIQFFSVVAPLITAKETGIFEVYSL